MATRSESLQDLFENTPHNAPDLTSRYTPTMEVQVNVSPEGGEPVPGKRNTWTDGQKKWSPFRMPKNAKDLSEENDWVQRFSLEGHASDIGMTGWDFGERCSRWVGFDFDSLVNHKGTGIPDEELDRIREALKSIPWVELRRSTSGTGLHLYTCFDRENLPQTANHTEHAALARAVLDMIAEAAGLDLQASVDACGGNLWVWSRRATVENQGLTLIKAATEPLRDVPENWRDYLVKKPAQQVKGDEFDSLFAAQVQTPLDDEHRRLIEWLGTRGVWQTDCHCLQTHTCLLAEAHIALNLKGSFQTISPGTDLDHPNCFLFALPDGAWKVFRFGQRVQEAATWHTTQNGWVGCRMNEASDLWTLVKSHGGHELPKGDFGFARAEDALRLLESLGVAEQVAPWALDREMTLRISEDQRRLDAYVIYSKEADAPRKGEMTALGWFLGSRPVQYMKVIGVDVSCFARPQTVTTVFEKYDGQLRNVVSEAGGAVGWFQQHRDGTFVERSKSDIRDYLRGDGCPSPAVDSFLRDAMDNAWRQSNVPFAPEYSVDRRWNRVGAQYAFPPAAEGGDHPHWDMLIDHCGRGLDKAIAENAWARKNGIHSGGDYLRAWAALLLTRPEHPLPYLFFFSPEQNTGKSSFGFALSLLLQDKRGFTTGENALSNDSGFNGELDGAVLVMVEEMDLSERSKRTYNRMKNLVTASEIAIHPKYGTVYTAKNYTHWVHSANDISYVPIFEGDSRVVLIQVEPFEGAELSWNDELRPRLLEEAPRFLRTLLDLKQPAPQGRLRLPVIETEAKQAALELSAAASGKTARPKFDPNHLAKVICDFVEHRFWYAGGPSGAAPVTDNGLAAELLLDSWLESGREFGRRIECDDVPSNTVLVEWIGSITELLKQLPEGSWSSKDSAFGRQLRTPGLIEALEEFGVQLSFEPQPKNREFPRLEAVEIGGHWTEQEIAEDRDPLEDLGDLRPSSSN